MDTNPKRLNRAERRRKARNTKWTKKWQDDRKYLTLFRNPGIAFMDCLWLQSAMVRLLVLNDNKERIPEYVEENSKRGGRLPEWFISARHKYLRKGDLGPVVQAFQTVFREYVSARLVQDLKAVVFTRNAIGHCYVAAGHHLDPEVNVEAPLMYFPRHSKDFDESVPPLLKGWVIEADERWMSSHQERMFRLFHTCELIADSIGLPDGMVY